jgi:hypothetical protein
VTPAPYAPYTKLEMSLIKLVVAVCAVMFATVLDARGDINTY